MHYCHSKSLPDRAFCNAELLSNLGAGHLLTVDAVAEADILGVTWLNDGIKQSIAERDDALEKLNAVRKENSGLSSELKMVKSENRRYSEVYSMLERIAPSVLERAKELVQEEKEQRQREQAQQIEYRPTKKKKSWGLE